MRFNVVEVTTGHASERLHLVTRAIHYLRIRLVHEGALQGIHVLELRAPTKTRLVSNKVLAHAIPLLQVAKIVNSNGVLFFFDYVFF